MAKTNELVVNKPNSINLLENIDYILMVHSTHLWQER